MAEFVAHCAVPQNDGARVNGIDTYVSEFVSNVIVSELAGSLQASTAGATSPPEKQYAMPTNVSAARDEICIALLLLSDTQNVGLCGLFVEEIRAAQVVPVVSVNCQ
jgi:hypothetical protein